MTKLPSRWYGLLFVAGCASVPTPVTAPQPTSLGRGLGDAWTLAAPATGALAVLQCSPRGTVDAPAQVVIVFDRPMAALGSAPPSGFSIEPPTPGVWSWLGTHTAVFEPEGYEFSPATRYRVAVPNALTALDGSALAQSVAFEFETEHLDVTFEDDSDEFHPKGRDPIYLSTAVPVTLERLRAAMSVQVAGQPFPFELAIRDDWDAPRLPLPSDVPEATSDTLPSEFAIRPKRAWPIDAPLRIAVAADLTSSLGPLPLGKRIEQDYRTLGPPRAELLCARDEQERCTSETLRLHFENPPNWSALRRALKVQPRVAFRIDPDASDPDEPLDVEFEPPASATSCHIEIAAGLLGRFGGRSASQSIDVSMAPKPPTVVQRFGSGQFAPQQWGEPQFAVTGTDRFETAWTPLEPLDLLMLRRRSDEDVSREIDPQLAAQLLQNHWESRSVTEARTETRTAARSSSSALPQELGSRRFGALLHATRPAQALASAAEAPARAAQDLERPPQDPERPPQDPARPANQTESELRWAILSDLALTSHLSDRGGRISVDRLSDASPLGGVELSLLRNGFTIPLGTTGADGALEVPASAMTRMKPWSVRDVGILARLGNDWNLLILDEAPGTSDVGKNHYPALALMTDRGVYRPGEPVYVKGYLQAQTEGKSRPLAGAVVELSLSLYGAAEPSEQQRLTSDAFGGFSAHFVVPERSRGSSVAIRARAAESQAGRWVDVADYRPASFETRVVAPADSIAQSPITFTVEGKTLSGTPMLGAEVQWFASSTPVDCPPVGGSEYSTSLDLADVPEPTIGALPNSGAGNLDAAGRFALPWTPPALDSCAEVTFTATVHDVGRQALTRLGRTQVRPGDYFVGIREIGTVSVAQPLPIDVVTLEPSGAPVSGRSVNVTLHRELPKANDGVGGAREQQVSSCQVTTRTEPVRCQVTAMQPGRYRLVASSRDRHGHVVSAGRRFDVRLDGAKRERPTVATLGDDEQVTLSLDRANYRLGDTAQLEVTSPFPRARAIVTLENERILWREERIIGAEAHCRLPVPASLGPEAMVRAILHRIPTENARDSERDLPRYAESTTPLKVAPQEWKLGVELVGNGAPAVPGAALQYHLRVTDSKSQPVEAALTVVGVDDGVLQLTNERPVDFLGIFTTAPESFIVTSDSRRTLGWWLTPPRDNRDGYRPWRGARDYELRTAYYGALDEAPRAPTVRAEGQTTFAFIPTLLTDARGNATLNLRLPQRITRYRVMVHATTKLGEFGYAEASVEAQLPVALRSMLPRFARAGDVFEAGVVATNVTEQERSARVRVDAQGLELLDAAERSVTLPPNTAQPVSFRFRARAANTAANAANAANAVNATNAANVTNAQLRFDVESGALNDALALSLPVKATTTRELLALYGETHDAIGERIAPLPRRTDTQLEVSFANSPLVGVDKSIEGLLTYEHLCTEQLASRLLVLGPLRRFATSLGAALPSDADAEARQLLAMLATRHDSDGFRYWERGATSRWLSVYVTWVLERSRRVGLKLPEELLGSAQEFFLQHTQLDAKPPPSLEERVFLCDVVAEASDFPALYAELERLLEARDRLPLFSRAQLLHAMSIIAHPPKHWDALRHEMLERLLADVRVAADHAYAFDAAGQFGTYLDSPDRTLALVLRALLVNRPEPPLVPQLLRGLLSMRRGNGWSSTQATAYAIQALSEYEARHPEAQSASENRLWAKQRLLFEAKLDGQRRRADASWPVAAGDALEALTFEHRGPGSLFYTVRLSFVPSAAPVRAASHGLTLSHGLAVVQHPDRIPDSVPLASQFEVPLGSAVAGNVVVISPVAREHVAVTVPFGAGLEPIDERLPALRINGETHAVMNRLDRDFGPALSFERRMLDDRVTFYIEHLPAGVVTLQYLARATTLGQFSMPAARAEAMYTPEHYATTAPATLVVRAR